MADEPRARTPDYIDVEVIRHPVGADGTMRHRFTFNVAIDRDLLLTAVDPGGHFIEAMRLAFENEAARLRGEVGNLRVAFGTSREDGMPLPDVKP